VDRCLAKDPWARFSSAAALVRAVIDAVEPSPPPLAVRAFLVRSAHLAPVAFLYATLVGVGLVPAALDVSLSTPDFRWRAGAFAAVALAALLPCWFAVRRVRWLLAAGHSREELTSALEGARARRLEELAFVYGAVPPAFERVLAWLSRLALVAAAAAVLAHAGSIPLQGQTAAAAAALALLSAVAARARTEQRTDPRGARRLRFWRGAPGRWLFRLAGVGVQPVAPIVKLIER
jgi:hypothetical protein